MTKLKKYAYLYRVQFWLIFLYIILFFILLACKKIEWINNFYFPFTILLFAVPIIWYKYTINNMGPTHPDLNKFKGELQNIEMFAAVMFALFGAFKILFYLFSH